LTLESLSVLLLTSESCEVIDLRQRKGIWSSTTDQFKLRQAIIMMFAMTRWSSATFRIKQWMWKS